jgi:hypothetical protein
LSATGAPSQAAPRGRFGFDASPGRPQLSGVADPHLLSGPGVTASPFSALSAAAPSDDVQANGDNKRYATDQFGSGSGLPANETVIAINPTDPNNVIAAANDYEPAVDATVGLYTSFDGGRTFPHSQHARQIMTPIRIMYGSGDPAVLFDRAGVAYTVFVSFGRTNYDSYIAVIRSEDGGVTWSVPVDGLPPDGDLTGAYDGIVVHNGGPTDASVMLDKSFAVAGPRPPGAPLLPGSDEQHISPDRLYVTWTRFDHGPEGFANVDSAIYLAYSDDQGRHFSQPAEISGAGSFCPSQAGDQDAPACDEDQFSVPVVDHRTGAVYVAFENYNTGDPDKNQYLVVRSLDGGVTWSPPNRVGDLHDGVNKYPAFNGRPTLDYMFARVNANGNLAIDQNTGRLYLTFADNRNGNAGNTNTDVFVTWSGNGGRTWNAPVNVTRESPDDQFFPWLSVTPDSVVAVSYLDRRYAGPKLIDTSLSVSVNDGRTFTTRRVSERSWNPDLAFRQGVFIGDYTGLATARGVAIPCWTDARFAEPNTPGNNPPYQQSDIMVDTEPIPTRG